MTAIQFKKYFSILLLLQLFLSYAPAYAQTNVYDYSKAGVSAQIEKYLCAPSAVNPSQTSLTNGIGQGLTGYQKDTASNNNNSGDLYKCINQIYKFAIIVASVVGVFFIVIAGYIYMSSDGNNESVEKAKSILVSTIASLVILMASYILLKAINPDLIQFHSIQPPSVKTQDVSACWSSFCPAGTPVSDTYDHANTTVTDLEGSGCAFQTGKQKNEAPQLAPQLATVIKNICYNITHNGSSYPGTAGFKPTISSIVGLTQHAANSYHYKGCAVDFAAGNSNFTTSPMGLAIIDQAKKNGISIGRINPGSDETRTDMVHIDLGSSCPNTSGVDPNTPE